MTVVLTSVCCLVQIFAVALEAISITGVYRAGIGYGHVPGVVIGYGPEPLVLLAKVRALLWNHSEDRNITVQQVH